MPPSDRDIMWDVMTVELSLLIPAFERLARDT